VQRRYVDLIHDVDVYGVDLSLSLSLSLSLLSVVMFRTTECMEQ